jgi:hypothetical protein
VYYCVGGIGKSSLRKELGKPIAEQDDVTSVVLDFETPSYRGMETALFALRKSLLSGFKVHFPTFDIAYAVYWQKSRPHTPMTGANLSLMEDSMVLSDLLAAVGVVPDEAYWNPVHLRAGIANEWDQSVSVLRDSPAGVEEKPNTGPTIVRGVLFLAGTTGHTVSHKLAARRSGAEGDGTETRRE